MHSSKITVPEHVGFRLKDNTVLTSLHQLQKALTSMNLDEFKMFTQPENHFANWVEGVFKDSDLAKSLRSVHTKTETLAILDVHLDIKKVKSEEAVHHPHKDVEHLHHHFKHMTRYDTAHLPRHTDPIHTTIRDRLIDFLFGLVIGLVMGFVLAQAVGLA